MADQIYVGQEALRIKLDVKIDISSATGLKMYYRNPDDTEGSWTGTLSGTTFIQKDFIADEGELDQQGNWFFWTFCTMVDGRDITGDAVEYYVKLPGEKL